VLEVLVFFDVLEAFGSGDVMKIDDGAMRRNDDAKRKILMVGVQAF